MKVLEKFKSFSTRKKSIIIGTILGIIILLGTLLSINHNNNLLAKTTEATNNYNQTLQSVESHSFYFDNEESEILKNLKNEQQEAYTAKKHEKINKLNSSLITLKDQCHNRHFNPLKDTYETLILPSKSTTEEQTHFLKLKDEIKTLITNRDLSKVDQIKLILQEATDYKQSIVTRIEIADQEIEAARIAQEEAERIASEQAIAKEAEQKATTENTTSNIVTSQTGTKYHFSNCRTLKKPGNSTTVEQAKNNGYQACKVCQPPQ